LEASRRLRPLEAALKVTVERPSETEAVLNVELDWDELEKASDRAYRKLAQKYVVPGFRKGHAPRSMLERMVGKEAIYHDGLEDLMESSYRDAVRQNDIKPLGQPELDAPELKLGEPFTYTARIPVQSPITLGDYHSIRVERPSAEVTDEDVQKVIENIQQDQAMWLPVERPAQIGDKVIVDLKLDVGDREIANRTDDEFELADERPGIFSGMDQQLAGMTEGESKEFTTTIPADYANTDLAGKEAQYVVTLKGVKVRELPAIDDELAKSAGDYDSLEGLRTAVREQLSEQKQTEARRALRENVVKAVTDQVTVEVHPRLVHEEAHVMVDEMRRMLERNRLGWEQYLSMTGKTEEQFAEEMEPEARERAKRDLVLDAVADAEHIEATDAEIEGWLAVLAAVGGERRRLRDLTPGQRANIARTIRRDNAIDRLIAIATEGQPEPGAEESVEPETPAESASPVASSGAGKAATPAKTAIPSDEVAEPETAAKTAIPSTAAAEPKTAAETATSITSPETGEAAAAAASENAAETATSASAASPSPRRERGPGGEVSVSSAVSSEELPSIGTEATAPAPAETDV
jgi:trigger factor